MLNILLILLTSLYACIILALFTYGINFYYLIFIAVRENKKTLPPPSQPESWPKVTVQLPIYNEMYVAQRLINAAAAIDYPNDLLQIQVLDDSSDETIQIAAQAVAEWQARGKNIVHLHRTERDGFKAGALRDGLETASGEFVAIFDADFVPAQDFLKATIPHFHDANIAFVQTRWDHLNRDFSVLTLLQSLAIDAHFMIEQFARSRAGLWFNFNGTAGIWRAAAIDDAGGWQATTLTEDLDLSYRAALKGWQAVYLRDVNNPAELPISFNAFRRQQHRWARGSMECAQILIPQVLKSNAPLRNKIQSVLHLTGYFIHLLMFILLILYPFIINIAEHYPQLVSLVGVAIIFNSTALAPALLFIVAQQQLKRSWWRTLPILLLITAFGSGLMLNTIRAAFHAVTHKNNSFERTPKSGLTKKGAKFKRNRYTLKLDRIVFWEILFGLQNMATAIYALVHGNWLICIYAFLFGFGLLFASLYTIIQTFNLKSPQHQATDSASFRQNTQHD